MCGIAAVLEHGNAAVDPRDLRRMCSTIAHRGPDDAGYALAAGGRVGLGAVRLRIMDPEHGDQPVHNEDGTVSVVLNGEIYDAKETREELTRAGHRFRTTSDTEVLVHLYEEEGTAFLERLNGEFAFVLWDERKGRMLAARDPMGVKPLHYRAAGSELLLCSEAKGILCLDRVPRALSTAYVVAVLSGRFPPARCAFEGISCVKPGHVLVAPRGGPIEERAYTTPSYETDESLSFEDAKARVRERLERAVRRRLVADVPVHAYLSGGLDSTAICALMAKEIGPFVAYNIAFPDSPLDESAEAAAVAKDFGLHLESVPVTTDTLAADMLETLRHTEVPLVNPHAVAKMQLSRRVRDDGNKVCLTGEGADEVFAGYEHFRFLRMRQMAARGGEEADALCRRYFREQTGTGPFAWQSRTKWRTLPEAWLAWPRYRASRNLVRRLLTKEAVPDHVALLHETWSECFDAPRLHAMDQINAARLSARGPLNGYILPTLGDRVEMANAVECRTPFLDRELVSLANTLPSRYLVDGTELREKYVLHEAVRDLMPRGWSRRKHQFLAPSWKEVRRTRQGTELYGELMRSAAYRHSGLFRMPMALVVRAAWRLSNPYSRQGGPIDALCGVLWSFRCIEHLFVENRVACDPDFAMTDRTASPPT